MRKLALLCLAATVVLYSCKKTDLDRVTQQEELLSTETIDAFIKKQVSETKSYQG